MVYGGQLTIAMARSKLDEHKLRDVNLEVLPIGDVVDAGPFKIERIHLTHSIPDSSGDRADTRAGHDPVHRRLQVRPDAGRRRARRHLAAGRARPRESAAAVRRLDERRPPGHLGLARSIVGPHLERVFARCQGRIVVTCFASQHPPRPAGRARRRGARPQGRAGRALDAQEHQHRPLARPHRHPRGDARAAARDRPVGRREDRRHLDRLTGRAAERAAPDGLPRPPAGRAARRATRWSSPPRRSRATSARSTRRSTACTTSAAT